MQEGMRNEGVRHKLLSNNKMMVGVDKGEMEELGLRVEAAGVIVSTHEIEGVRRGSSVIVGRKVSSEYKYVTSKADETKGNSRMELLLEEGGREGAWKTRIVPNRYDYGSEGNRVNRASATLNKRVRSKGMGWENREANE